MRGIDKVVGQRLVHIVDEVQPLWRYDGVFLSSQVPTESLQTDLVCMREGETRKGRVYGFQKRSDLFLTVGPATAHGNQNN